MWARAERVLCADYGDPERVRLVAQERWCEVTLRPSR